MKCSTLVSAALCLASQASAFYIWEPCIQDGTCRPNKTNSTKSHVSGRNKGISLPLTKKSRSGHSRQPKLPSAGRLGMEQPKQKRDDDEYDILEAATPTYSHTVGVDQDGDDISYFISVGVGSENKEMYMLIDTGAGSTWIMGSECKSDACGMHNTFAKSDSTTLEETDSHIKISYGSGSVTGQSVRDSLTVADITVTMAFGLANDTSSDFESFPFDGILGLSLTQGSTDSYTATLNASDSLSQKVFSIYLARAEDEVNNGELTLGGINSDRYDGDITYTELTSKTSGAWSIPMDGISLNGEDLGISGRSGYIDTGTSYIFGPPDDVTTLHSKIDGANSTDGSRWTVPCDTNDTLALSFSGQSWTLERDDWISGEFDDSVCYSYVMGVEVVSNGWLLGDSFLKNVYSVFDMENHKIGFAKVKAAGVSTTSTSTASSSTSTGDVDSSTHQAATASSTSSDTSSVAGLSMSISHVAAAVCLGLSVLLTV